MKLHWSPRSPFVRKVMVAAHELGMAEQFELVRSVAAMKAPNEELMRDNPLSKIPTLVLDDGSPIFDSLTICEFLNQLGGGTLFPEPPARWPALTLHALGTGLLDLLILWRNERDKPALQQTPEWIAAFSAKTKAGLDRLEKTAPVFGGDPFHIGHIAVGCCLSYLDFRFPDLAWRDGRPVLSSWHETFCARPSAQATEIVNDE
jgi:glutathione S-transferase